MDLNPALVDGEYATPGVGNPFLVRCVDGDIHCFTGYRHRKPEATHQGNVVFQNGGELLAAFAAAVREAGEMRLAPAPEERLPDAGTAEAFLRAWALGGNLASYFPPNAERLGLIVVFKKERALYCRPAPGADERAAKAVG
ncbi:MAG: hypothetical protein HY719_11465 [Planctomycetes bacterium]|nr:hypothetical protein [Planctomycetota bacterium]